MKHFGLLGKKLEHSFSQRFFEAYFAKLQLDATYSLMEVEELELWMSEKSYAHLTGFNVTIPYKEAIMPYLDVISEEAAHIGAVNVVKVVEGKLHGFNTDAFGFQQSIKPFLDFRHQKALILGTGGASKAVAFVLKNIGLDVLYVSTSQVGPTTFSYDQVNEYMLAACKMIINTTPLGTFPETDAMPAIPTDYLTPDHFVVDLIYNPAQTLLLKRAAEKGAMTLNGESMLKEQALKSWEIWNN